MRQCLTMLIGIVVLLSTTGLPRMQHLCGGIVQSVSLWVGTVGCDHEEAKDSESCTARITSIAHPDAVAKTSCCKKPNTSSAEKKDDCCTDKLAWEPSQQDLAFADEVVLESPQLVSPAIVFSRPFVFTNIHTAGCPIRPPPPIPPARLRALYQVYRC